jgi:hypothetical protein
VLRAKNVLAAADGVENKDIANSLDCTRRTVGTWRNRFAKDRLEGIEQDAPQEQPRHDRVTRPAVGGQRLVIAPGCSGGGVRGIAVVSQDPARFERFHLTTDGPALLPQMPRGQSTPTGQPAFQQHFGCRPCTL